MSSIRKRKVPLWRRAKSQLNKAVRAPPMWRKPVGDGANLVTIFMWCLVRLSCFDLNEWDAFSNASNLTREQYKLRESDHSIDQRFRGTRASILAWVHRLPTQTIDGWRNDASRRVLFVPVLVGCGVGFYFSLLQEPSFWWIGWAPALLVVWIAMRTSNLAHATLLLGAIAALSCGFSLAVLRAQVVGAPVIARETRLLTITGRIADLEPSARGRTRVILDIASVVPAQLTVPKRIRLSISTEKTPLHPGDWIRVRTTLRPPPAPVAPGSFDFGRKLWFEGVGAIGFTLSPVIRVSPPARDSIVVGISSAIQRTRHAVSERILRVTSDRTGPIAAAFLTGERGLISDEDNVAMRDSSLAHLLSISGLHMMLAGFGFFAALRILFALVPALVLVYPVKKWAAAGALLVSFAYLLLSGASVPTQRAFAMVLVAFVAIIFDRTALSMRTVSIAALAVLVIAPESWMDPSFQMSFAAVVALISAYEWWSANHISPAFQPGPLRRFWNLVVATAATSVIAGIATAPFAAFHFNRFSDYGVVANVMVMPMVSFVIMPSGVVALLVMPFGLEEFPLMAMEWGLGWMLACAHWVASWPGATQAVQAFPVEALLLVVAGGLWMAIWQAQWRWLGLVPLIAGAFATQMTSAPDVFIAGDGGNVAVRDRQGLLRMESSRRGRFDAEMWLRADGDSRDVGVALQDRNEGFTCDHNGCVAEINGRADRSLVVSRTGESVVEDCASATVLVDLGRGWRPACDAASLTVTRSFLEAEGAVAVRLTEMGIDWTTVARERGQRFWSPQSPRNHAQRLRPPASFSTGGTVRRAGLEPLSGPN